MVERCECGGIEKIATSIETSFLHNNSDGWHSLLQKLYQFSINQAPSLDLVSGVDCWNIFHFTQFSANGKSFSTSEIPKLFTKCTYKSILLDSENFY